MRALEFTKLALHANASSTEPFDVLAQALLFESPAKTERIQRFLER
jgi:hypothetical protein